MELKTTTPRHVNAPADKEWTVAADLPGTARDLAEIAAGVERS